MLESRVGPINVRNPRDLPSRLSAALVLGIVVAPGAPAFAAQYTGCLRFFSPDRRVGSTVRVIATGISETIVLTARSGSFDRSGRTLRATTDPRTGAMTFANCQERLQLVMSWALDSDCVLRRTR